MNDSIKFQILVLAIAFQACTISYFLLFARKSKMLHSFITFNLLMIFWNFSYLIEILQKNSNYLWLCTCISYTSICFLGVSYFNFVKHYTSDDRKLTKKLEKIFLILSILIVFCIWTNSYHNLFYIHKEKEYMFGILYYILLIETHIAVVISIIKMLRHIKINKINKNEYYQSIYLLFLPIIVSAYNIMHNINNKIPKEIELTPAIFSILVSIFAVLSFKYKFFDYLPLGINKAFDIFMAPAIISDTNGVIIRSNQAFKNIFQKNIKTIDEFVSTLWVISNEKEKIKELKSKNEIEQKISVDDKTYMISKTPIKEKNKTVLYIVTLTDISHYIQEEKANQVKQIFSNLHDDIGNSLTAISKIQESAIIDIEKNDIPKVRKSVEKSYELSILATKKLRESVTNIKNMQKENTLSQRLNNLKENFKIADIEIDIYSEYEDRQINEKLTQTIYNISQESITNAIKHGKANKINILIKKSDYMTIYIIDNGIGVNKIEKGHGLNGIMEKLEECNGKVSFTSSDGNGFTTKIIIKE